MKRSLISILVLLLLIISIPGSNTDPSDELEQIRAYSRIYEFDYVSWTASAFVRKLNQAGLNVERYLSKEEQHDLVLGYLDLVQEVNQLESDLNNLLADPGGNGHNKAIEDLRGDLSRTKAKRIYLTPFVEQILQDQINTALVDLDMAIGGQLIPPVLFRSEPNSLALIVSPREEIRQAANLMLIRGLDLDQIIALEEAIEMNLELSALVVGIGGVGLYPSMIIESPNLDWMIHVIGHEWTHNYLTIRPLGAFYGSTPELTTINETVADLSADEIRARVFQLYYPEFLPPELEQDITQQQDSDDVIDQLSEQGLLQGEERPFDFREQMHITRLEVDRLLSEGKIEEAEQYMEKRRRIFWENGYIIRKLNQAYFAFHGSYAADPGGAADQEGADLGALLRELKSSSSSYKEFMRQVSWKWRLGQFEEMFAQLQN